MTDLFKITILVLGFFSNSYSQLTHSLIPLAQNLHYGSPTDIAISADGVIFLTNGSGGVRAYRDHGNTLELLGNIDDSNFGTGGAEAVCIGSNETIFVANDHNGLLAYRFEESNFLKVGEIDDTGAIWQVALGPGNIVFTAGYDDALRAYLYDGTQFILQASVSGYAKSLAVANNGTIFVAHSSDGLSAYNYTGAEFTLIAHVDDGGSAYRVTISENGTIFLSNGYDGLRAYSFENQEFTLLGHQAEIGTFGVLALSDTLLLVANDASMDAYYFDGINFFLRGSAENSAQGAGLARGADGTIYLAQVEYGLRSYSFNGNSFIERDSEETAGLTWDVEISNQGQIYIANNQDGIRVYDFDGQQFLPFDHFRTNTGFRSISTGLDNYALATSKTGSTESALWIFNANGNELSNPTSWPSNSYMGKVLVSDDGAVFLKHGYYTLQALSIEDTIVTIQASLSDGIGDFCLDTNGLVVALNSEGIGSYQFSGESFAPVAQYVSGGGFRKISLRNDGILFATTTNTVYAFAYSGENISYIADHYMGNEALLAPAFGEDGTLFFARRGEINAYVFDGAAFTETAAYSRWGFPKDIAVGPEGTIFVADETEGLTAFQYSYTLDRDSEHSQTTVHLSLRPNFPNPFNSYTQISYENDKNQLVSLTIYNQLGREVYQLVNEVQQAGEYSFRWNGKDKSNMTQPSGLYFYQLSAGTMTETRKMMFLK